MSVALFLRLWVGRRKEPILGYVPKNYEKEKSGSNGLNERYNWPEKYLVLWLCGQSSVYLWLTQRAQVFASFCAHLIAL